MLGLPFSIILYHRGDAIFYPFSLAECAADVKRFGRKVGGKCLAAGKLLVAWVCAVGIGQRAAHGCVWRRGSPSPLVVRVASSAEWGAQRGENAADGEATPSASRQLPREGARYGGDPCSRENLLADRFLSQGATPVVRLQGSFAAATASAACCLAPQARD